MPTFNLRAAVVDVNDYTAPELSSDDSIKVEYIKFETFPEVDFTRRTFTLIRYLIEHSNTENRPFFLSDDPGKNPLLPVDDYSLLWQISEQHVSHLTNVFLLKNLDTDKVTSFGFSFPDPESGDSEKHLIFSERHFNGERFLNDTLAFIATLDAFTRGIYAPVNPVEPDYRNVKLVLKDPVAFERFGNYTTGLIDSLIFKDSIVPLYDAQGKEIAPEERLSTILNIQEYEGEVYESRRFDPRYKAFSDNRGVTWFTPEGLNEGDPGYFTLKFDDVRTHVPDQQLEQFVTFSKNRQLEFDVWLSKERKKGKIILSPLAPPELFFSSSFGGWRMLNGKSLPDGDYVVVENQTCSFIGTVKQGKVSGRYYGYHRNNMGEPVGDPFVKLKVQDDKLDSSIEVRVNRNLIFRIEMVDGILSDINLTCENWDDYKDPTVLRFYLSAVNGGTLKFDTSVISLGIQGVSELKKVTKEEKEYYEDKYHFKTQQQWRSDGSLPIYLTSWYDQEKTLQSCRLLCGTTAFSGDEYFWFDFITISMEDKEPKFTVEVFMPERVVVSDDYYNPGVFIMSANQNSLYFTLDSAGAVLPIGDQ